MIRLYALLCAFGALVLAGCSDSNRPVFQQTFAVKGKVVTASGAPLTGGRIELHPENSEAPEARGMIKTDGTFVLGTYKVNDGVAAGRYKVTIDPVVYNKAGNLQPNKSLPIAKRYADPEKSGLTLEVKGDTNDVVWKLQ
jgi:hypothetical protein